MGYSNYIDIDLPYASYPLDTLAGARSIAPFVSGSGNAQVVGGANTASFTFPGFQNSRRNRPWALEVWFRPEGTINEQVIVLGHSNYDGIVYDGTQILFIIKLVNSTVTLSYIPDEKEVYHVVGSFDGSTASMWVNGDKVTGVILDPASQVNDLYASGSDSTSLVSGVSASGNARIAIDAFATYTSQIKESMPSRHWNMGRSDIQIMRMISAYGANVFELNDSKLTSGLSQEWTSANWLDGVNTTFIDTTSGNLMAQSGQTGIWQDTMILDGLTGVTGSVIEWSGSGALVETSIDLGASWQTAQNGYTVPKVSQGAETGVTLLIRVTLTGTQFLSRLYVNIYTNNSYNSEGGNRIISMQAPSLSTELFYPIEFQHRAGVRANPMKIAADSTATIANMTTIEFWVKVNNFTSSPSVLFDTRTASATGNPYFGWSGSAFVTTGLGTVYLDGVAFNAANFTTGEWHHIVIVRSAAENIDYAFGSDYNGVNIVDGDYGMIMLYPQALSSTDVSDIYGSYFDFAGLTANEGAVITVAESASTPDLYAYDWSLVTA